MNARLTVITATNPNRLTKRWALVDGVPVKESAGHMVEAYAEPKDVPSPADLDVLLGLDINHNQALCFGVPNGNAPANIASKSRIESGKAKPGSITRSNEAFRWPDGAGWLMLDYDPAPNTVPLEREALLSVLCDAAPALCDAPMLWGTSSSSFIYNDDTGEEVTGLRGQRFYVLVQSAADIPRAGKALFERLWLRGHGYYHVSKCGTLLERSVIDAVMWQPCRLDFVADPVCEAPLVSRKPSTELYNNDAAPLDSLAAFPPLTRDEKNALGEIKKATRDESELVAEREAIRDAWIDERLEKLPANTLEDERKRVEVSLRAAVCTYRLWGDFELIHSSGNAVTVGELLDDPDRWHGQRFADPLEPGKDQRVAWLNLRSGGRPFLYSHAHGGQRFTLMRAVQTLQIVKGELPRVLGAILERLRSDGQVFERAGILVRFADDVLVPVERPWLQTHIEEAFTLETFDARSNTWRPQHCPDNIPARVMSARGRWKLPKVSGVVTFPVMRADGCIINHPGFDADTGLLFIDNEPTRPTPYPMDKRALSEALERIWAPFAQFPFDNDVSRGVFMCALLTTVCRPALPTAPAFLIRAYAPGTGKSLLSEILMMLVGAPATALPLPESNPEEIEKRLFSKLRTGCAGMVLDNLTGVIESAAMCAVLTSAEPEGRILGLSEVVRVQNRALFVLNGNNVAPGGDLFRRVLPITLDANTEAPERRRFSFDPRHMIRQRLEAYRSDLLSVLLTYQAEGAPVVGVGAFGSFDEWERLVRQCVCWLISEGVAPAPMADPLEVLAQSKAEDPRHLQHIAILEAWHGYYGPEPVRVKDLSELANSCFDTTPAGSALKELLQEVGTPPRGRGEFNGVYFSAWLRRHKGQVVSGLRLDVVPHGKTVNAWGVTRAA
mgnify:CR=1 FL=1|jgi:hypothetical protein